jgi:hypothetical protein
VRALPSRQALLVEVGGEFVKATGLTAAHWGISIGLALISFPVGVLARLLPVPDRTSDLAGYVYDDAGRQVVHTTPTHTHARGATVA